MPDRVSPFLTGPYSPAAAVGATARGAGADFGAGGGATSFATGGGAVGAGAAATGGGAGRGAGAGRVSATGGVGAAAAGLTDFTTAGATGGSSSTVYSRSSLPLDQLTWIRKSRNGSRTISLVVSLITVCLPLVPMAN